MSGSGKSTLAFDILFNEGQRRYLESLNAYARSIVQPAGPARGRCGLRHSADGRDRAAPVARRPQEHGRRRRPRSGTSCACCTSSWASSTASTTARRCSRRASRASPRSCCATSRGQHVGLLAPLVVARKGVYTDLAKWAQGARPHAPARRRRVHEGRPVAAPRPLQGAHARAAGGRPRRRAANARPSCATLLAKALDIGKGVMHLLTPLDRPARRDGRRHADAGIGTVKVFSTSAPARPAAPAIAELDPRMFSYNSKHGWCTDLRRHRPEADARAAQGLRRLGPRRRRARPRAEPSRPKEAEVEGVVDEACPDCARHAPQRRRRARSRFEGEVDRLASRSGR